MKHFIKINKVQKTCLVKNKWEKIILKEISHDLRVNILTDCYYFEYFPSNISQFPHQGLDSISQLPILYTVVCPASIGKLQYQLRVKIVNSYEHDPPDPIGTPKKIIKKVPHINRAGLHLSVTMPYLTIYPQLARFKPMSACHATRDCVTHTVHEQLNQKRNQLNNQDQSNTTANHKPEALSKIREFITLDNGSGPDVDESSS